MAKSVIRTCVVGLGLTAIILMAGCAVTVAESRFYRPHDAENFVMRWSLADAGKPRLSGEPARIAIFEKFGLDVTNDFVEAPSGRVEIRHVRQSDPDRPIIVYCGGTSFDLNIHGDTIAFIYETFGDLLIWNYPGYGQSDGKPSRASLTAAGTSMLASLNDYRRPGQDIVFWGHSLGGFVCADLATEFEDTSALILETTAPSTGEGARAIGSLATRGIVRVKLANDVADINLADRLSRADFPILVLGGGKDRVLPVELSQVLAERLKMRGRDVTYIEYPNGNHFLIAAQPAFEDDVSAFLSQTPKDRVNLEISNYD